MENSSQTQGNCDFCKTAAPENHVYYPPVEDEIAWFPEQKLIYLYFGKATWTEEMSDAESDWIFNQWTQICDTYPDKNFFVIADFSAIDDSEFTSRKSLKHYADMTRSPRTDFVVAFGASPAMRMILQIINKMTRTGKKIQVVTTQEEALEAHHEWLVTGEE